MGMSKNVEADGRRNSGTCACLCKRPLLVRGTPRAAIAAMEYVCFARASGCKGVEQSAPFICQHNVPHFSSL